MNVVVVSDDTVLVDDVLYRRVKTVGGKYPLDYRRSWKFTTAFLHFSKGIIAYQIQFTTSLPPTFHGMLRSII